ISATNVFAHIDDLDAFMGAIDRLLAPDGNLVIEAPHFLQLVRNLEYDTIYHEHLSYLSAKPLVKFFRRHDMEVIDLIQVGIHRGILEFVTEKSGLKIGRYTPGGRIPVLPDEALKESGVDYGLLLAWNFADEIMRNLSAFREAGGRFIIPIPSPRLV